MKKKMSSDIFDTGGRIIYPNTSTLNGYKRWTEQKDIILMEVFEQPNKTLSKKKEELIKLFNKKGFWSYLSYGAVVGRYYKVKKAIKSTNLEIEI